jgi:copper chaperone CopZ
MALWLGTRSGGTSSTPAAGQPHRGLLAATTAEFKVDGMFCSLCAANLGRVLGEQPGVVSARVDFDDKVAVVQYDPKTTTSEELEKIIEESAIFRAELMSRTPETHR